MGYIIQPALTQQTLPDTILLTDDDVVAPPEQEDAFWSRLVDEDPELLKWAVISHWQQGCTASEAIFWLKTFGIVDSKKGPAPMADPGAWMKFYVAVERKKAENS